MIMIKIARQKAEDLKDMIGEGMRIFGRAMTLAEDMCRESEIDERRGRVNHREDYYLYPVDERNYHRTDMRDDDNDRERMYERRRSHDRDY